MSTWNSRGLRGSVLEELVNKSNEQYRDMGLALIQKVPTPITPIQFDKDSRHITLAYFEKKSTVDYIGAVQGIPVCFDAKECKTDTFPLANVHQHQIDFMTDFEKQNGLAFILIYFVKEDIFYYLTLKKLLEFKTRADNGGIKRFRFDELPKEFVLEKRNDVIVPYLDGIEKDLESRKS